MRGGLVGNAGDRAGNAEYGGLVGGLLVGKGVVCWGRSGACWGWCRGDSRVREAVIPANVTSLPSLNPHSHSSDTHMNRR